jgi:hypothetical protein
MSALKLLLLAALAAAAPEGYNTSDGMLYVDNLALVDRAFDAVSLKAARDAMGPRRTHTGDSYVIERTHLFADAELRISYYYESFTLELYPHRPLERGAAFKFAAPLLADTPFAKKLPPKPAKATPRHIEWELEHGASYTLSFDLDGKGRVIKVTMESGV